MPFPLSRLAATRAAVAALALAGAVPSGAAALTAEELLAAQNNLVARLGFTPLGRIEREGGSLRLVDSGGRMVLPFDWGEIGWHIAPLTLAEEEGAVTVTWEGGLDITLDYRRRPGGAKPDPQEGRYTTVFTLTATDHLTRATGTPEAVTLTGSAAMIEARLTAADWWQALLDSTPVPAGPHKPEAPPPHIALSLQDWQGEMTLEGFTPANTGTARFATRDTGSLLATQFTFLGPSGSENGASAQEDLANSLALTLPATPLSLTDPGAALRAGFALVAETASAAGHAESTTRNGDDLSRYRHDTGPATTRLALGAETGLTLAATGEAFSVTVEDGGLADRPWSSSVENFGLDLALPLMARGAREKAHLAIDLGGLRSDTGVFFGRNLPEAFRAEPFTFGLTLGADYEPLRDLTDFGGLIDILETQDVLRLYDFGVDRLDLRYGEAALTGGGRVGWGLYGAPLNDALPNPKGRATFTLTAAYALLNRLGQAQLVPAEFLSAARGAVAAFGQAKGPDVVESTIVLGPDGLKINGVPAPF